MRPQDFVANIIEWCRANPNDCRMDYLEVQVDKDTLDELAIQIGVPVIAWHTEPCHHDCFDCRAGLSAPAWNGCPHPSAHQAGGGR